MKQPRLTILGLTLGLCFQSPLFGSKIAPRGNLRVTVVDESGHYVSAAHVYVYGQQTKQLIDGRDAEGVADFVVPPGAYRVYSAVTKKDGDYVDHFSSHEAHVVVGAADSASVVLTLKLAQNPIFYLSEYARKKIGLDDNLNKYLY